MPMRLRRRVLLPTCSTEGSACTAADSNADTPAATPTRSANAISPAATAGEAAARSTRRRQSMMPPLSVAPGKKGRAMPPAPVAPPPPPPPPLNVEMGNILEGEDEHGDWHMMNITGVVEAGSQYSAQVMPASYKMYKAEEARIAKLAKRHGIKNETDIPKPGFEPTAAPPMLAGAEESDDEDKKEPLSEEEMSELKAHAQKFRFVEPWPTVYEEYLRATPAPPPPVIPTIMPEFEKGEHPGEMFVIPITTAAPVNETAIEEGEGAEGEAPAPPAPAYFYYY